MAKTKKSNKKEVKGAGGKNGIEITGFVLGILSVLFAFLLPLFGLIFGVIGLILTFMQRKKLKTKISSASLILNIIGIVLSTLFLVLIVLLADKLIEYLQQYPNLQ